jgi:hypothetical protein
MKVSIKKVFKIIEVEIINKWWSENNTILRLKKKKWMLFLLSNVCLIYKLT